VLVAFSHCGDWAVARGEHGRHGDKVTFRDMMTEVTFRSYRDMYMATILQEVPASQHGAIANSPVPKVAESGHDVVVAVESLVYPGGDLWSAFNSQCSTHNAKLGELGTDAVDTFGRRHLGLAAQRHVTHQVEEDDLVLLDTVREQDFDCFET